MSYYYNRKRKIFGTEDADTLDGTSRNDKIYTFDGNDIVNAGSGNDRVYLGNGDDFVNGGNGRDWLYGNAGNDIIIGGRGSDRIYGGDGDDIMTGDAVDGSNGWWDRDVFNLGRVEGTDSGNDIITDFDTNNYWGGEWNYDKLSFTFNNRRFNLSEGHDLVWFTYYIEHDGDINTDAVRDGNDLIFVFERDENGYAKNSVRLEDVIGDDGVTNRRLDWASVDDITNVDFNLAVVAEDDVALIGEKDGAVTFASVLNNDSFDNGLGTVDLVSDVDGGTLTLNADGTFSFDAGDDFSYLKKGETAEVSFTYSVTDIDGDTDIATVTITVTGTDDAPVIGKPVDGGELSQDDGLQVIDLLANASDPEGGDLDVTGVVAESTNPDRVVEFTIDNETGEFSIDPAQFADLSDGENETVTLTYFIVDDTGNLVETTATFFVAGADDAPVVTGQVDAGTVTQDGGVQTIDLLANASDVDGDDLDVTDVTVVSSNGGRTVTFGVDAETGELTIDPAQFADLSDGDSETLTVTYLVDDGTGNTVATTATLIVDGANDVPTVSGPVDAGSISQDGGVQTIDLLANASDVDWDDLDVTDVTVVSSNGGRTVTFGVDAETGELTIDPAQFADLSDGDSETLTVTYLVDDGTGNTVATTATLVVDGANDVPTVSGPVDAGSISQDGGVQTVDLLANASDVDGDDLDVTDVTVVSSNGGRTVQFVVNNETGVMTLDPSNFADLAVGETETLTISYTVNDGTGNEVSTTGTVDVVGTNDGPVADASSITGDEDTVMSGQLTASDIDGDDLTFALDTDASNGTVTVNVDGSYDYTPAADYFGTDSFTYTVDDGNGGTDTQTVTITVNDVIDNAPVPDAASTTENVSVTIDVLANDVGTGLQVTSATASSGAAVTFTGAVGDGITLDPTGGTVIDFNSYNGAFSYDSLVAGDSIADIITYATVDADGNVTEAATVTRHVVALNEMGSFNTASLDLDGVTITGSSNVNVLNFNGIGVVGGSSSSFFDIGESLTFTFDNPSTNIQLSIGTIGNTTSVDGAQVELEGFDADGNSLGIVTVPVDGGNLNANLSAAFNHQPLSSLVMVGAGDRFIFRTLTFDEIEGDGYAIVEVQGADDAPVITPLLIEVDEDSAGVSDQALQISDPDRTDQYLDVELVSQPGEGSASVQEDYIDYGNFTVSFDPGNDFQDLGVGEFRDVVLDVVVTDRAGNTNSGGEVVVRVMGTNDGPVADASSITGDEDTVMSGQLTASDIDGDDLTFALDTDASNGTVTVNVDGSYDYTPAADYFGTDSFTYTVDDGNGGTDTQTVTITVNDVIDNAPVPDAASTTENVSVTIDVLANDVGTGLQVTSATASSGAAVTFTGAVGDGITLDPTGGTVIDFNSYNGAFSYDSLVAGDSIADIITYATVDADGNVTEAATVTRHVVALNEMGSFNTASLDLDGVTITGSSNVNVLNFNGIGVVGGSSSSFFDIGESLTFTFDNPSTNIQLSIGTIGNTTSVDGAQVELEGFDADGNSLGIVTVPVDGGNLNANLSAAFNHQPLSSLVMVGAGDRFIFRTLTFDEIEGDGYAIVEVQGADDAPVITPLLIEVDEDSAGVSDQALQISDPDRTDQYLDVELVSQPGEGSASVQEDYIDYGNFTVSFDPGNDFQDLGVGEFRDVVLDVVVTDRAGNTNSGGEVVVRVMGTNDGPVADASSITGDEDTVMSGQLTASDIDGDDLTFALDTDATNGSVTVNADGSYDYTPNSNFSGADSFTYTVDDGNGGTATETVSINVNDTSSSFSGSVGAQAVPNIGRWFIIDFDAQTISSELRTGGSEPPNPPTNGIVIHLNPNNANWGAAALSYLDGAVEFRDANEFDVSNYTGTSSVAGDVISFVGTAIDTDLSWSATVLTPDGPYIYTVDLNNIDFTSSSISLDGVSFTAVPLTGYNIIEGTNAANTIMTTSDDDYVAAQGGDDIIQDIGGSDILDGGLGNDMFIFADSEGHDTILDFGQGDDTVDLTDFGFNSFSEVAALMTDTGDDIVLTLSADQSITFENVADISDLTVDDFLL